MAMTPHIVAILRLSPSVVLDFPANTTTQRGWMRRLIDEAKVARELHLLDMPDALCLERLRQRNASGEHPLQVSETEFAQFTRHFVPPSADEGFSVVVHPP
jgi:predicted kinase